MPKLSCRCGYVFDLSQIPDEGYIVVEDIKYERLIEDECYRASLSDEKKKKKNWDKLIEADKRVVNNILRMYICSECNRLYLESDNKFICYTLEKDEVV